MRAEGLGGGDGERHGLGAWRLASSSSPALPSSVTLGGLLHVSELLPAAVRSDTVGQHGLQSPLQL